MTFEVDVGYILAIILYSICGTESLLSVMHHCDSTVFSYPVAIAIFVRANNILSFYLSPKLDQLIELCGFS